MKRYIVSLLVCFSLITATGGCAARRAPASLSGAGLAAWQANEVVIALDAVMNSAIALNELIQCDPNCHPVLSEQNARIVVQSVRSADIVIKQFPAGYTMLAATALDQIDLYLDTAGKAKLSPYIAAARAILVSLGGR